MARLYTNGTILTLSDPLYAQALLEEDGRIAFVGARDEALRRAPNAERVDLQGCTLMPAFIDPHSHFSAVANGMTQVDLDGCESFEDIAARVRVFLQKHDVPAGAWVQGSGYDHNLLAEQRHPTRALLDAAAPGHPLAVIHASGHVGVFNSLALKQLGVTAQTPVPEGGKIEIADGEPTGYMEENAFIAYRQKLPMPSMETLLDAYRSAQSLYASYGIATVQEGMLNEQLVPLYRALLASGLLEIDVVGYADAAAADKLTEAFAGHIRTYRDHFKLGGYKIFLDGSPQGRTAWMRQPYAGEREYRGYGTLSFDQTLHFVQKAVHDHMQLLAHCNGDAAAQQLIDAVRRTDGAASIRPVIVHAQLIGLDQLDDVRALGMAISFFPAHVYYWGDTHIRNFGMERARNISPARSALEKGIPFTFHQDAPVVRPDMLRTVWCAAKRMTRAGVQLDQAISVLDALRAVTVNAAWQYFEEDEKGSLAIGKRADMTILDRNPLTVDLDEIPEIRVLETFKDGRSIYHN